MELGKRAGIAVVVAAMLAALTACGAGATNTDSGENGDRATSVLRIGIRDEWASWDPAMANVNDTQQQFQAAYDTIIRRDADGGFEPMLGVSWDYDAAQLNLTVRLREGVTFSDGTPFDAAAVVFNMQHFRDGNGPQAGTMKHLGSVEAVDDHTVVYHLTEADPAFLLYLAGSAGFQASPTAITAGSIDAKPVGTGPYVLNDAETTANATYTLTAREAYWAPELQKFSKVQFVVLIDDNARLNALLSGQIDAALLKTSMASQLEQRGMTQTTYEVDWHGLVLMDRAGAVAPALKDVRVRQAINYAIDRKGLLQANYQGQGTPTSQFFGPATAAYREDLDGYYTYDVEKARQLMAEAGYADGFEVTIPSVGSFPESNIPIITDNLGAISITVNWSSSASWGGFITAVTSGEYPMPFVQQVQGDTWVEVQKMVDQGGLYNPFNSTDQTVAALIGSMQNTPSGFDAAAAELGKYLVEQAWYAPFYRVQVLYGSNPDIEVVRPVQVSTPPLYNYSPAKK